MCNDKIIDFHVHVGNFDKLRDDIKNLLMSNDNGRDFNIKELFYEPDVLGEYLKENGVEKAVLLGEDGPGTNYHITSEFVCNFKERASEDYTDMFICFGSLNLKKEENPMKKYKNDIALGIKGYKLYPSDHDFNVCDDRLMDVYAEMEKNRHILMFHTGSSAQIDSKKVFENPKDYLEIVKKFPSLKIIFCHGGKKEYAKEMREMMLEYKNVYMDTGFITASYLMEMFDDMDEVSDKIIFASDLPGGIRSFKTYIDGYKNLAIKEENIEKILYKNAMEILKFTNLEE